jgi:hypothetical protein
VAHGGTAAAAGLGAGAATIVRLPLDLSGVAKNGMVPT